MLHFISVLGTSNYAECTYKWEKVKSKKEQEFAYTSRFVQIASLNKILNDNINSKKPEKDLKISIFLTKGAKEKNWKDRKENDITVNGLMSEINRLGNMNPEMNITIDAEDNVCIPEGRNQGELDEIFNKIFQSIEDGEKLYFDVTHGLRSIPILALTITNYARAVKNISVGGIYYGAFELRNTEVSPNVTPCFDMTYCDSVLQWTGAAESFRTSGSSNQIKKVYNRNKTRKEMPVKKIVNSLNDLTNCLETSRGLKPISSSVNNRNSNSKNNKNGNNSNDNNKDNSAKKSIYAAYEEFEKNYNNLKKSENTTEQVALENLFGVIEKETSIFNLDIVLKENAQVHLSNTSVGIPAVLWAINKGLTQQGLTALETTITTYIGELLGRFNGSNGIIDENKLRDRGIRSNIAAALRGEVKGDLDIQNLKDFGNLANCCFDIKECRNSINHFGCYNHDYTYDELNKVLKEKFRSFLECVDKECELFNGGSIIDWYDREKNFHERT